MNETERESYRCLITLRDKKSGVERQLATRTYKAAPTAKGQATYIARAWRSSHEWVRTELQQATWTTLEVLK